MSTTETSIKNILPSTTPVFCQLAKTNSSDDFEKKSVETVFDVVQCSKQIQPLSNSTLNQQKSLSSRKVVWLANPSLKSITQAKRGKIKQKHSDTTTLKRRQSPSLAAYAQLLLPSPGKEWQAVKREFLNKLTPSVSLINCSRMLDEVYKPIFRKKVISDVCRQELMENLFQIFSKLIKSECLDAVWKHITVLANKYNERGSYGFFKYLVS